MLLFTERKFDGAVMHEEIGTKIGALVGSCLVIDAQSARFDLASCL